METATEMQSPCVDVCVIDAATGLCAGCGRTLDEIAGWATMTPGDRLRIMTSLPARRLRSASAEEPR